MVKKHSLKLVSMHTTQTFTSVEVGTMVILSRTGSKGKWLKSYLASKFHHINKNGMVSMFVGVYGPFPYIFSFGGKICYQKKI